MNNAQIFHYWDGSTKTPKGMVYLSDDGQLCQLVGVSTVMNGKAFVGELLEHPTDELDISLIADCKPFKQQENIEQPSRY